jgi:hypothetical protein
MKREDIKTALTKLELTFSLVMERLKVALGLGTDADLAGALGMSTSNYANRKRVDSIPFDLIIPLCLSRSVSIDWLCTGAGEPFTSGERSNSGQVAAVNPVLLAQVLRELETAFDGTESAGAAGKVGFMAGVVYNAVAGERNQAAQLAQVREKVSLLASAYKVEAQIKQEVAKGPAQPSARRT